MSFKVKSSNLLKLLRSANVRAVIIAGVEGAGHMDLAADFRDADYSVRIADIDNNTNIYLRSSARTGTPIIIITNSEPSKITALREEFPFIVFVWAYVNRADNHAIASRNKKLYMEAQTEWENEFITALFS